MIRGQRKRCSRCRRKKCLDDFHVSSAHVTGRQAYCKDCKAKIARETSLSAKFGLTVDEYNRILEAQGGTCAICDEPNLIDRRLGVDHDHETGAVRGILCHSCNLGLGFFRDSTARMHAAITYLTRHHAQAETNEV